jgi:hypothetical protein
MRILAAIPHYFDTQGDSPNAFRHGSLSRDPSARIEALSACISALRQMFDAPQVIIDIATGRGVAVNQRFVASRLDIVVCTTRGRHLLPRLSLPPDSFLHHPTNAEPLLLGFECHAALHERIGDYDYYCYFEDDLVITDPWLFAKLSWFRDQVGPEALLLPNRFEVARQGVARKAYLDGDLAPEVTAPFQDRSAWRELRASFLGVDARFVRPLNPHSGCFFLGLDQMRHWALRPDFLDRDCGFIGPLESAASLGVMRAFRVYKPAPEVASFLEIAHFGTAFIDNLRLAPTP